MGVPRHLQVPLSIDTNISYSLDKSMFPGLDDPRYKHEPVLLIASDPAQPLARINMHRTVGEMTPFQGNHTCARVDFPKTVPSTDDLLEIKDFNTDDLLSGLKNTKEYLSLFEDVMQELPHSDELQYLDGPERDFADKTKCNQLQRDRLCVNKCASGKPVVTNGYPVTHHHLQWTSNFTGHNNRMDQSVLCLNNSDSMTFNGAYISKRYSSEASCVNNPVYGKRKRTDNYLESSYQKKPYYSNEFVNYISHHQPSWKNCGYGFTGTRNGNQIRVM